MTELGNFGVQTHPDKSLHDLDFADDTEVLQDREAWRELVSCGRVRWSTTTTRLARERDLTNTPTTKFSFTTILLDNRLR